MYKEQVPINKRSKNIQKHVSKSVYYIILCDTKKNGQILYAKCGRIIQNCRGQWCGYVERGFLPSRKKTVL